MGEAALQFPGSSLEHSGALLVSFDKGLGRRQNREVAAGEIGAR